MLTWVWLARAKHELTKPKSTFCPQNFLSGLGASHEQSLPFTWAGAFTGAVVTEGQLSPGGQLSAWAVITWVVVTWADVAWGVVGASKKKLGWSYLHVIGSVSYPVFPPSLGSTNFYWFLYKKESRLCLKLLYYLPVYCLKVLHRDGTKWGRFHPYNLWSPRIVWSGIVTNNTYTINIVSLLPSKFIETLVITNIGCVLKYFPPSVLRLSESAHFTDLR